MSLCACLRFQVVVTKDDRMVSMRVDTRPTVVDKLTRRVNVIAPVYVGGLPPHFETESGVVSILSIFHSLQLLR